MTLLLARFNPRSAKTCAAGSEPQGELPNWGTRAVGIFVVGTAQIDLGAPESSMLRYIEGWQVKAEEIMRSVHARIRQRFCSEEDGARTLFTGSGSTVQKRNGSEA